ncbi:MAG: tetratricopeptide repeat protein [Candidatus Pacebacteria bacterium]|nr:tetratricopeptide repeat protein [Candidatus Paceibacterota bacterium]
MIKIILFTLILIIVFIVFRDFNFFLKEVEKFIIKIKNFFNKKKEDNYEKHYLAILKNKNKNNNFTQNLNRLCEFYISQGRYEEAVLMYEKMLRRGDLQYNMFWNSLAGFGSIAEKRGDFNLAIEYVKKGEDMRKHFSHKESSDYFEKVYFILSNCYLKIGDKKKSLDYLRSFLKKNLEERSRLKIFLKMGENLLEFFDYKNAKKYFERKELEVLNSDQKNKRDYLLCMSLLGMRDYDSILEIGKRKDFFQSGSDLLILGLYSLGISNVKKNFFNEAEKCFSVIFPITTFRLDIKDFYKFYYYNLLLYYGLGLLNNVKKEYDKAEINFQKMLEIIERIPPIRYQYFLERTNIYFFKILANFELIKIEKNIKKKKEKIKILKSFLDQLTTEERSLIGLKEIGNEGSIINKINNYK